MRRAACSRADLVRAWEAGGEPLLRAVAELLGYEPRPEAVATPATPLPPPAVLPPSQRPPRRRVPDATVAPAGATPAVVDVPFWRPIRLRVRQDRDSRAMPERKAVAWEGRPAAWPTPVPLAPVSALLPRLRRAVAVVRVSRRIDVDAVVRLLGRGRDLVRVPRVRRLRWGHGLQVICDRSLRLVPYWGDQDLVLRGLGRLYPTGGLEIVVADESVLVFVSGRRRGQAYVPPSPGIRTLVLGDLGGLDVTSERRSASLWHSLGRRLAAAGLSPAAVLPCRPGRLAATPPRAFRLLSHEPGPAWDSADLPEPEAVLGAAAEKLLTWLAPAVRIQPELLRRVRLELGRGRFHAGIESIVWQHPAASTRHPSGLSIDPVERHARRQRFGAEDEALRRAALDVIRLHRGQPLPESIWYEEILELDPDSQRLVPPGDLEAARSYVRHETLPVLLAPGAEPGRRSAARWLGALADRWSAEAWARDDSRVLRQCWLAAHGGRARTAPFAVDPQEALSSAAWPERRVLVLQMGSDLVLAAPDAALGRPASPLGSIRAGFPRIRIARPESFWSAGEPPRWASQWGRDAYGAWVDVALAGVRLRLRWIPAGRFRMGSPVDEPGRWDNEGPQHEVALERGYWLFATPCTQALWEAVMGGNPSRFRTPERPVERVRFDDCQEFLRRANERVSGLGLVLPSEAQWEYACRAGTQAATYAGAMEIVGANNAPVLDEVAWYGGNSGEGFELEEGEDSSGWREKQYQHKRAGTHPVGRKRANGWGLYDMLGNVREWVEDTWHESYDGAPVDGTGWVDTKRGSARVVRGGSWHSRARDVGACALPAATGARPTPASTTWASVAPEFRTQPSRPGQ